MKKVLLVGLVAVVALFVAGPVMAQAPGECTGGLCGTPDESGGGCGCGCGSILIANTDLGDTYQYADDYDEDGIEDDYDNCPFVPNLDQADSDGDMVGSACDNCDQVANEFQLDADGDLIGDACDPDIDGDTVDNVMDNCQYVPNLTQVNTDADLFGDACDPDIDEDGWLNIEDNCPFVFNPDQLDTDPNHFGDACNSDKDNDGVQDFVDNCPMVSNPQQANADGDLMGDLCDADMDDDGILNEADNCKTVVNNDQRDEDRDGSGDVCDSGYCYVVDQVSACLDPTTAFSVYAGADRPVQTGETVPLLIWANRKNRAIEYEWTMVTRPDGSSATVHHPRGSATLSTPYNYHYKEGRRVEFTPDMAGEYVLKLTAKLVFADDLYPEKNLASVQVALTAEGDNQTGGCSTAPAGGGLALLALLGLALVRRKR
jgi:MYXO-CTERM domain-containing protein